MKTAMKHFWLIAIVIVSLPVITAAAAPLPSGTKLGITPGTGSGTNLPCVSGSCFGMEVVPGLIIWTDIGPGTDGGIIVGKAQASGGQELAPSSANTTPGQLTNAWLFFGNYGTFFTTPGGDTNIFDDASCAGATCVGKTELRVWDVAWNGNITPLGNQEGVLSWVIDPAGNNYSLDYKAMIPCWDCGVVHLRLRGSVFSSGTAVSGFWPATATPGSFVFVFGSHFAYGQNTKVSVNGINAPLVLVIDPTVLIFALPSGDTTGPITVTTADGSATSTTSFGIPINGVGITGFWPAQGQVGSVGFVFGGGFVPQGTQVAVNGVTTPAVQVLDPGLLLFIVPPGASTGPISVKTAAGQTTSTTSFVVLP